MQGFLIGDKIFSISKHCTYHGQHKTKERLPHCFVKNSYHATFISIISNCTGECISLKSSLDVQEDGSHQVSHSNHVTNSDMAS